MCWSVRDNPGSLLAQGVIYKQIDGISAQE